jgi:hypothetical protein
MNRPSLELVLSVLLAAAGGAASAYACCAYKLSWSGDPAPCSGEWTSFCETSSPACTPSAANPDVTCQITGLQVRRAKCYRISGGSFTEWCRCACNQSPGDYWVLVGKLPDGSCCWVKNYTEWRETHEENFNVNVCKEYCVPQPSG